MSEDMQKYWDMFTAAWKLFWVFRKLSTDKERYRLLNAAEMIYHKYTCQFMLDLIWAVLNELDRRAKNERNTNDTRCKRQNR